MKSSGWSEEKEKNTSRRKKGVCESKKDREIFFIHEITQERINLEFFSKDIIWVLQPWVVVFRV